MFNPCNIKKVALVLLIFVPYLIYIYLFAQKLFKLVRLFVCRSMWNELLILLKYQYFVNLFSFNNKFVYAIISTAFNLKYIVSCIDRLKLSTQMFNVRQFMILEITIHNQSTNRNIYTVKTQIGDMINL